MTFTFLPSLVLVFASTGPMTPRAEREYVFAEKRFEQGTKQLAEVVQRRSTAARLNQIDRSIRTLRHARNLAAGGHGTAFDRLEAASTGALVLALCEAAEIHVGRNSLNLAAKRVDEALALDPSDAKAQQLKILVMNATVTNDRDSTTFRDGRRLRARRLGLLDQTRDPVPQGRLIGAPSATTGTSVNTRDVGGLSGNRGSPVRVNSSPSGGRLGVGGGIR